MNATRRGLLGSAVTVADLRMDAELLDLCQEQIDREARHRAEIEPYWSCGEDEPKEMFERHCASVPRYHEVRMAIAKAEAASLAGVVAKARVVLASSPRPDELCEPNELFEKSEGLAWSLARDLLALVERAQ